MAKCNNNTFTTLLKASHKIAKLDTNILQMFENSYRDSLCDFNFEHYILANCEISLPKKCEALRYACTTVQRETEVFVGEDMGRHKVLQQIHYQIWTPVISQSLQALERSAPKNEKKVAIKQSSQSQPAKMQQNQDQSKVLPEYIEGVEALKDELRQHIAQEVLFPVLCKVPRCKWCTENIFIKAPVSKCGVDCKHANIASGYYPHVPKTLLIHCISKHANQEVFTYKEKYQQDTFLNPLRHERINFDTEREDESSVGAEDAAETMDQTIASDLDTLNIATSPLWSDEVEQELAGAIVPITTKPPPVKVSRVTKRKKVLPKLRKSVRR